MENQVSTLTQDPKKLIDCENSGKSFTIEPEMEDFSDSCLLKNLIQELGIDEFLSAEIDPLKHDSLSPSTCIHCKLLKKISGLQADISTMNKEICATSDMLYLKKEQNVDLKGMIKRLEQNLGKVNDSQVLDKSEQNCSCMSKCDLF